MRRTAMDDFWLSFVPLFAAVDAPGALPLSLGLTSTMEPRAARRMSFRSVATATVNTLLLMARQGLPQ